MFPPSNQDLPIVVTGASSGIGAKTCQLLRAQGCSVIGVDRQQSADAEQQTIIGDLGSAEGIASIERQIPSRIGGLMNIAGVPGTAPTEVVLSVNVLGLVGLSEALAPRIGPGGFILNLSSNVADRWQEHQEVLLQALKTTDVKEMRAIAGRLLEEGAYRFSKECVRAWTQLHSARLQGTGVRVNSISPGPVETPILQDFRADHGAAKVDGTTQLVGRFGRPEDIAHVLLHLASDDGAWINGTDIRVDGGLSAARWAAIVKDQEVSS